MTYVPTVKLSILIIEFKFRLTSQKEDDTITLSACKCQNMCWDSTGMENI